MAYGTDGEKEVTSIGDLMDIVNEEFDGDLTPQEESEESSAKTTVEATQVDDVQVNSSEDSETVDETYTPDFSYNVKGEEMSFDDRLQSVVKTKEDEDYVRELLTKAGGLDAYKEKVTIIEADRDTRLNEAEDYRTQLEATQGFYQDLIRDRDAGNFRGVSKAIGISDDDMLKFALEIAAERELPADQRSIAENSRRIADQAKETEIRLANQQASLDKMQFDVNTQQLKEQQAELVRSQTDDLTGKIADGYADLSANLASVGLDMFTEAVQVGKGMLSPEGVEPTVDDVLAATAAKYSKIVGQAPAPDTTKVVTRTKKATIPTVETGNSNIVASQISSMDDIKKELERISKQPL